jgi:hypothetical protein
LFSQKEIHLFENLKPGEQLDKTDSMMSCDKNPMCCLVFCIVLSALAILLNELQILQPISTMARHTTAVEKAIICTMKKHGSSHDVICAALTDNHNLTNHQINCIFAHYRDKENYNEVGHQIGRPHKLTPCDSMLLFATLQMVMLPMLLSFGMATSLMFVWILSRQH